ncbi:MAG: glycosyltransferase family 2 protein [Deltaproteobacteria bacterium]|jgi:glycosyltransferase involved in cell wall biosynthesis|nr:glycosyltransferase family 2 protein [Deltaproteobacteria bacterium]
MDLDIVVLTKNEARNLPACLESVRGLGRVVVIDDNSSDETVSIALAAGAEVHSRALDDFSSQRNFGLSKCSSPWVFFLDADERVAPGLALSIGEAMRGGPVAGRVLRRNFAFGRRFRFGHLAPDKVARLFPRGRVEWRGEVHESPETDLPVADLAGHLEHHTYGGWGDFLAKMQRYSAIWAGEAAAKGKKSGVCRALAKAACNFLKTMVLKLGFLDGPAGAAVSAVAACYTLNKYLLLCDKTRGDD